MEPTVSLLPSSGGQRATFADVAMRVARDGPLYGVLVLMAVLVMKGHANSMEAIVGAAAGLLAHSYPNRAMDKLKAITTPTIAIAATALFSLVACTGIRIPAGTAKNYEQALAECNRIAKTCEQSIQCENEVRAAQKPPRPQRTYDGCK